MNVTLSHTLTIPNGEVYKIIDSNGIILWKKERKYIISFNANGGSGTMPDQEFSFGELQALPTNTFTKSGSTFFGWSLTPDGMAQYIDGQSIIGIGNGIDTVVLYAVWTTSLNTTYTYTSNQTFVVPITGTYSIEMHGGGGGGGGGAEAYENLEFFNTRTASGGSGGGSGELYTTTLIKGTSYSLTIGKGGSGGSGDYNSSGTSSTAKGSSGSKGGTTKFGSLYSIAGGFGGGGGTARASSGSGSSTKGSIGSSSGSLASGSSGGATTGSYGDGGYGGSGDSNGSSGQNGAIIIKLIGYAPYTVVFNSNGGTGTMSDQSFNVNETKALNKNTLSKENYIFLGWSTSADGDVVYTDGEYVTNITNSGETITLYAVWEAIIPSGQQWIYTSNDTFIVPKTGQYSIEMHGGGGGGGGGGGPQNGSAIAGYGGVGGGSGELYNVTLTRNTSYALTIGKGGAGGKSNATINTMGNSSHIYIGDNGSDGGTTSFGTLLSIEGGKGGTKGKYSMVTDKKTNGTAGASVGSLASGQSGGATTGSYGNGGNKPTYEKIYSSGSAKVMTNGKSGTDGVIIITYLG